MALAQKHYSLFKFTILFNPFRAEFFAPLLPPTAKFLGGGGGEKKNAGYFLLPDVARHTSGIPDQEQIMTCDDVVV